MQQFHTFTFNFSPQLKSQMMLLEAQLEKQSDQQGAMEELEQVHQLFRSTQKTKENPPPPYQTGSCFSSLAQDCK